MVRVKICGIRTPEAALAAVEAGAHALGFVFAPSPRRVTPQEVERIIRELPLFVSRVGVFVDAPRQEALEIAGGCRLDVLQFLTIRRYLSLVFVTLVVLLLVIAIWR